MKFNKKVILNFIPRMIKKSEDSRGKFTIVAIQFSGRGDFLGIQVNGWSTKFDIDHSGFGKGKHQERSLMNRRGVKKIFIIRFGKGGDILPINACKTCQEIAQKKGIEIIPLHQNYAF